MSYAIPVKHEVLGVPYEGVLSDPGIGAVSSECAEAMACGARDVLRCDVAVSTTGIAGPGGDETGKPTNRTAVLGQRTRIKIPPASFGKLAVCCRVSCSMLS